LGGRKLGIQVEREGEVDTRGTEEGTEEARTGARKEGKEAGEGGQRKNGGEGEMAKKG